MVTLAVALHLDDTAAARLGGIEPVDAEGVQLHGSSGTVTSPAMFVLQEVAEIA